MDILDDCDKTKVRLRSNLLSEVDFKVNVISDDDFISKKNDWEEIFEKHTGASSRALRYHLLNILRFREVRQDRKMWFLHRWSRCLFDSISPKYFLLSEIFVPTSVGSEQMRPFLKLEDEGFSDLGRKDVTYLDLSQIVWGKTGNTQLVREKLNGVHVEKILIDKCYFWSMLGFLYKVTESPVEVLEWTEDGVFGLYPYGIPDHMVSNVMVYDHRWHAPSPSFVAEVEEGIMLLQGDKELRLKRIPTIEVMIIDELWEVGLDDIGLHRIRPRYGKKAQNEDLLDYLPTLDDLIVPTVAYHVSYAQTGAYSGKFTFSNEMITIDSGYRLAQGIPKHIDEGLPVTEVSDVLAVENIYYYMRDGYQNAGPQIQEKRCQTGVKAIVFDQAGVMYLVKDEDKPYDFIGGTVSYGEAPVDTLLRELWEEIGYRGSREELVFLGISTGIEKDCDWHTYLYLLPSINLDMKKFLPIDVPQSFQPWVPRIRNFIVNMIGDAYHEYYLLHTTVKFDNPTQSQMRVIGSIVSQSIGERRFHTGPDLMHVIYKCAHVDRVDFSVLRVILSVDLKILPYINPLCDHRGSLCECTYAMIFQAERKSIRARSIVVDLTSWIIYVCSNYVLSNGVPKKNDRDLVGPTIAKWIQREPDKAYKLRKRDIGMCTICKLRVSNGYWFDRQGGGTLCPKCYVRTKAAKPDRKKR